jgi:hypothetical protein
MKLVLVGIAIGFIAVFIPYGSAVIVTLVAILMLQSKGE